MTQSQIAAFDAISECSSIVCTLSRLSLGCLNSISRERCNWASVRSEAGGALGLWFAFDHRGGRCVLRRQFDCSRAGATGRSMGAVRLIRAPREVWAGAEAFGRVLSLYTGSTFAPFGNLRRTASAWAVTAMSRFEYSGLRYDASKGDAATVEFEGVSRTSDLFVGYQWASARRRSKPLQAGNRGTSDHAL